TDASDRDYPVGYGKPPRHTQFKPGQSGHPSGRPKHAKNFATALHQELQATVRVTEDGRRRKLSKQELLAKRLVNKAVELNPKFAALLVSLIPAVQKQMEPEVEGIIEPSAQQLLTETIVQRIRAAAPAESAVAPLADANPAAGDMNAKNAADNQQG